jgi:hypothetical protein
LTVEMGESLNKIDSHDVIETGYSIDERLNKKKVKKFRDSYVTRKKNYFLINLVNFSNSFCFQRELRFIEAMESVCENILTYNVHAERPGSLRYSKGESQTMGTLKGLRLAI